MDDPTERYVWKTADIVGIKVSFLEEVERGEGREIHDSVSREIHVFQF